MLISAALHRRFPNAAMQSCRDGEAALVHRDRWLMIGEVAAAAIGAHPRS